jgi:type III secretory pathway component EscS
MFFGVVVAIFQAATQIQEQTLSFTIKLVAVTLTLMFMGPWLGAQIMSFSLNIFENFAEWSIGNL